MAVGWSLIKTSASLERYDEASYYIQQSLAIARQTSEIRTEGMSLTWLGAVHECLGSFETAISLREQGVAALKQARDKWQYAYALRKLAEACHHHGRAADAIDNYQRVQEIVRQIGDRRTEADILFHLGYA